MVRFILLFSDGNISGANQPLRANYKNFNLGHQINISADTLPIKIGRRKKEDMQNIGKEKEKILI